MSFFDERMDDVDMTTIGSRHPYFLEGNYVVRIVKVLGIKNRNGRPFFIVNGEVLQSNVPERPPGMICAQVVPMDKDTSQPTVKRFVCAALGLDPNNKANNAQITGEVCNEAISESQPLADSIVKLACTNTITQKGQNFTVHNWEPMTEAELQAFLTQRQQHQQGGHQQPHEPWEEEIPF